MSKPTKRTIHYYSCDSKKFTVESRGDNFIVKDGRRSTVHIAGYKAWAEKWLKRSHRVCFYEGRALVIRYEEMKRL